MCKACEVGKIVVNRCLNHNLFINTKKLQKLLVLMQIECIRDTNKPLFKEDIRIWDCGVAIKEVDGEFSGNAIRFSDKLPEYITLLEAEEQSVNDVLRDYGKLSAAEINDLPVIRSLIEDTLAECGDSPHITADDLIKRYGKNES